MKYYPHHIGDFDRATRHLTRVERSIYRDLIELYYDTEEQITLDRSALCRKIIARTDEEVTAVEQVLNEFFNETKNGWYHARCDEEIITYKRNASQKALAGKASAEARKLQKQRAITEKPKENNNIESIESVDHTLNARPTAVEQPSVTSNHKPVTNKREKNVRFIPPTINEVINHIMENSYTFDPEAFIAFYESNGWRVGKNKMKSWKSACVTWEKRNKSDGKSAYQQRVEDSERRTFGPEALNF